MKKIVRTSMMAAACVVYSISAAGEKAVAQATTDKRPAASQSTADADLDTQFIQILARMTSNRLAFAKRINEKVPGTVSPDDVANLEQQLKAMQSLEEETKRIGHVDLFSMQLAQAQVTKTFADMDWKQTSRLQQQSPDAIPSADAELIRLRAELANVNLQRGKAAEHKSAQERLDWSLQSLFVTVQALQGQVERIDERE
jgi:hypothetical protein